MKLWVFLSALGLMESTSVQKWWGTVLALLWVEVLWEASLASVWVMVSVLMLEPAMVRKKEMVLVDGLVHVTVLEMAHLMWVARW
jgi:hypothetical protein